MIALATSKDTSPRETFEVTEAAGRGSRNARAGLVSVDAEPIAFSLPEHLEAHEPPEARGLARDEVRLMVSCAADDSVTHTRFTHFAGFLRRGDVVVVNTSATLNAALPAVRPTGDAVEVHLSQRLASGRWVVELRRPSEHGTRPLLTASAGEVLSLPESGRITLLAPYMAHRGRACPAGQTRLRVASVEVRGDLHAYLDRNGFPIRYGYVPRRWPLADYQTLFAHHPGSAEMPSAGRPFSSRVLEALAGRGVEVASILLHTGVASLEDHEPPYPEFYRVDAPTAHVVNEARERGGRIVAVGTTAVRALETVARPDGTVMPGVGWTDLVITPERGLHAVDALLTGFHEPRASHLAMLEALAGRRHVQSAYAAALGEGYLWHEFGDVHLVLPGHRITH
jgi:S-adenosylmethionine:tRNA ribosyltransferase-isomerase